MSSCNLQETLLNSYYQILSNHKHAKRVNVNDNVNAEEVCWKTHLIMTLIDSIFGVIYALFVRDWTLLFEMSSSVVVFLTVGISIDVWKREYVVVVTRVTTGAWSLTTWENRFYCIMFNDILGIWIVIFCRSDIF